ncbi:uncharacterized protein DEA37_0011351 [Paragonimus westermani]|uniref:Uncharacterized protein n=1 Tax=Paragonimus westermani TaxID=34504 RepID=A0A5J4NFK9_9TREM|nr:uncharacterized protein DEA37_0011351 [Paragonimus westermani]
MPSAAKDTIKETNQHPALNSKPPSACWYCKEWHSVRLRPFKNRVCNKCGRRGHKEICCHALLQPSQRQGNIHRRPKFSSMSKAVSATFEIDGESKRKYVTLFVNGVRFYLQLTTASDITLISRDTWRKLGWPPLLPMHHTARNASGELRS